MRRWLRSWFTCRFGLVRLVVAVVCSGAVVGLNMREIGPKWEGSSDTTIVVSRCWGWPLPFVRRFEEWHVPDQYFRKKWADRVMSARNYEFPLTHGTYRLMNYRLRNWTSPIIDRFLLGAISNALFTLTILALILFLQIPRREVVTKVP